MADFKFVNVPYNSELFSLDDDLIDNVDFEINGFQILEKGLVSSSRRFDFIWSILTTIGSSRGAVQDDSSSSDVSR